MKGLRIDTRRPHRTKSKGTKGSYYHKKQKRSKIVRKISGQVIRMPDGSAVNVTVSVWKNRIGQYFYTAREVMRIFDSKQKCWTDIVIGTRLKAKHLNGCAWAVTKKDMIAKEEIPVKECKGNKAKPMTKKEKKRKKAERKAMLTGMLG